MHRFIYEKNKELYIYDVRFPKARIINLKTGEIEETDNKLIINKIIKHGKKAITITNKN